MLNTNTRKDNIIFIEEYKKQSIWEKHENRIDLFIIYTFAFLYTHIHIPELQSHHAACIVRCTNRVFV